MKKQIGNLIFFLSGWKSSKIDFNIDRCVVVAAPHTSNWDFLYAMAVYWRYNVNAKFFIKDSYTKGFMGYFFKKLGAIGVTKGKKNNLVDFAVKLFNENEKLVLLVPAEATRKRVSKWKKGFYIIAQMAKVPVALGYLDYEKKIAGVGDLIDLTDSFEDDMQKIQDFYKGITAKYPENYNKQIY
ncbi:MAG: 1-acyl-sn-glycerol-3-phosphate acyltransferase [Flavobacteriaceae bacterium]|nr:1-acyl-sn-glycerol-3-phosphate acyltransferase [Flavobacteriaceae bacterium]